MQINRLGEDVRQISLSALQHYAFCPRQCALIHNEQAWADNYLTAQGSALHERADSGESETRKNKRFERSVHLSAEKLGLIGIADMVECDLISGSIKPVEYKHGKPKLTPIDKIQLCAQALCLEEMTGQTINEGALWYEQTKHRLPVIFSKELRAQTMETIQQVKALLFSGKTPLPQYGKHCKSCSLEEICQPKLFSKDQSKSYIQTLFEE